MPPKYELPHLTFAKVLPHLDIYLFSSKPGFKTSLFAETKATGPGGILDSIYRSAFDLLCDLNQVTALLWSLISPTDEVDLL